MGHTRHGQTPRIRQPNRNSTAVRKKRPNRRRRRQRSLVRIKPRYGESTQWLPGDNINTGIGQGFVSVTAIQLANAYAAFANGGTLFSPNIVEKVVARSEDRFGSSVIDFDPRIQRIAEFPEGSGVVREGLHGVTSKARRGTAWRAFEGYDSSGYAIAGKTGTAQAEGKNPVLQRKKEDSAVFVAWAPRHEYR